MFVLSIEYIFSGGWGKRTVGNYRTHLISFLGKDINERIPFECAQVLFAYSRLLRRERYAHNGFR